MVDVIAGAAAAAETVGEAAAEATFALIVAPADGVAAKETFCWPAPTTGFGTPGMGLAEVWVWVCVSDEEDVEVASGLPNILSHQLLLDDELLVSLLFEASEVVELPPTSK